MFDSTVSTARWILVMAVVVCPLPLAAQTRDAGRLPTVPLPREVDRVLRDYERAWQARNAEDLAALFHDDGFVLTSGSAPVLGRAAIRQHYRGSGGALRLRAIGYAADDTLAYVIGMFGGASGKETGKFVLVLRRASTGTPWLIAADMDNHNNR